MKATVIREQPVQPPVDKIILEVTPAELVRLARAVGHQPVDSYVRPLTCERPGILVASGNSFVDGLYTSLKDAMTQAGLTR